MSITAACDIKALQWLIIKVSRKYTQVKRYIVFSVEIITVYWKKRENLTKPIWRRTVYCETASHIELIFL